MRKKITFILLKIFLVPQLLEDLENEKKFGQLEYAHFIFKKV